MKHGTRSPLKTSEELARPTTNPDDPLLAVALVHYAFAKTAHSSLKGRSMIVFTANFAAWALNSPSGKISVLPESLDSSKYKRGFLEFLPVSVGDSTGAVIGNRR